MRVWFYFHFALVLAVAVPITLGFERAPVLLQGIGSIGAVGLIISVPFPIFLAVLAGRRRPRFGFVFVGADVILVCLHWLAVAPLIT